MFKEINLTLEEINQLLQGEEVVVLGRISGYRGKLTLKFGGDLDG